MKSLSRSLSKIREGKHNARMMVTLGIAAFFSISSAAFADWHRDARPKMGTEVSVILWHDNAAAGETIIEEIFTEVDRINALMSTYVESSRISEINRDAASGPVVAGEELFELIRRSLDISVLTNGAFDITYESVGQHYDFRERQRPDEVTVEAERQHIGYQLVELDETASTVRFLENGVRINLGGIAKGYVVERGVEILRSHGVENGIVTAGGDSRLLGDRRDRPWVVGIRDPREDGQVAISVPLEDEAISTSGDYERYFEEDGVRYHHIIRPSSGLPVEGVHSATVIGPDAVLTDALSTSVFVMGVDEGLKLIACLPDYESIVIDAESQIFYSTGLADPQTTDAGAESTLPVPGTC
jgi:thiamine biosynthesis lipoprotein